MKDQRMGTAAEHRRVVLIAQRNQIAYHVMNPTNLQCILSLLKRNEYRLRGSRLVALSATTLHLHNRKVFE